MKLKIDAAALIAGTVAQPVPPPKKVPESWAELISDELGITDIEGVSEKRRIIRRVKELARQGIPWAVEFLANREEGKPKQMIDLAGKEMGPITLNIVSYKE